MIDCVIKSWDLFPVGGVSSRAWKLNLSKICVKKIGEGQFDEIKLFGGEEKKKNEEKKSNVNYV